MRRNTANIAGSTCGVFSFNLFFAFIKLTWGPMGAKISKRYFSHSYILFFIKLYYMYITNMLVMGNY